MSRIVQGRQDLARWRAEFPDNFFACDINLQHVLRMYDPECDRYMPALHDFGHVVATVIDPAAASTTGPIITPGWTPGTASAGAPKRSSSIPAITSPAGRPMRPASWPSRPSRDTFCSRARCFTC
ncbi:MAG: hypothetical protein ACUVR4_09670 [Anaerolineae bacterium]